MRKKLLNKPLQLLCSLLLAVAPLIISDSACLGLWGEPEIPNSLK
jgi:cyclic lactone autoinducer peptide